MRLQGMYGGKRAGCDADRSGRRGSVQVGSLDRESGVRAFAIFCSKYWVDVLA